MKRIWYADPHPVKSFHLPLLYFVHFGRNDTDKPSRIYIVCKQSHFPVKYQKNHQDLTLPVPDHKKGLLLKVKKIRDILLKKRIGGIIPHHQINLIKILKLWVRSTLSLRF